MVMLDLRDHLMALRRRRVPGDAVRAVTNMPVGHGSAAGARDLPPNAAAPAHEQKRKPRADLIEGDITMSRCRQSRSGLRAISLSIAA
jgi:hypothetical protein